MNHPSHDSWADEDREIHYVGAPSRGSPVDLEKSLEFNLAIKFNLRQSRHSYVKSKTGSRDGGVLEMQSARRSTIGSSSTRKPSYQVVHWSQIQYWKILFFLVIILIRLPRSIIYEEYCQCVTNKYLDNELGWQVDQFWSLFNFGELDGFHTNRNYQFYCSNNGRYAKKCNFVQKRSQSSLWVCLSLDWFSWWLVVKTLWLVEIEPMKIVDFENQALYFLWHITKRAKARMIEAILTDIRTGFIWL